MSVTEIQTEDVAIEVEYDRIFAGGPRGIAVSDNQMDWHLWSCPLEEVAALSVSDGLLAVVGDGKVAVSVLANEGRLWQVVHLDDKPICVQVLKNRVYVGTHEGRLFHFDFDRRWFRRLRVVAAFEWIMKEKVVRPIIEWCG